MIGDLRKVAEWWNSGNAYTNKSTGLHMNISLPNFDRAKLDFVKLAILMGDDHVSSSFGRLGTHYAQSAMEIVKNKINDNVDNAAQLLTQMRSHLNTAAAKIIHSGTTSKMTSINVKDGRVEFRSPGGDWVQDVAKVENTLLRFVVALDAAMDETKYKEEYAKKLYKLLARDGDSDNTIQYFTKFAAGGLSATALSTFVQQVQQQRRRQRASASAVQDIANSDEFDQLTSQVAAPSAPQTNSLRSWKITIGSGTVLYVQARNERDARATLVQSYGNPTIEQAGGITSVEPA